MYSYYCIIYVKDLNLSQVKTTAKKFLLYHRAISLSLIKSPVSMMNDTKIITVVLAKNNTYSFIASHKISKGFSKWEVLC
jgi:hypothetical protein